MYFQFIFFYMLLNLPIFIFTSSMTIFISFFLKVDELDKAIAVAAKDPARYSLNEIELERRRKWTSTSRHQAQTCSLFYF